MLYYSCKYVLQSFLNWTFSCVPFFPNREVFYFFIFLGTHSFKARGGWFHEMLRCRRGLWKKWRVLNWIPNSLDRKMEVFVIKITGEFPRNWGIISWTKYFFASKLSSSIIQDYHLEQAIVIKLLNIFHFQRTEGSTVTVLSFCHLRN